jgi:protein-glutamine gamma-glutamyltransferase
MIAALNRMRAPGSFISAYLQDVVVTPDFEYLRQLTMRENVWESQAYNEPHAVVATIGRRKIIFR